jgi:hypothetical protein
MHPEENLLSMVNPARLRSLRPHQVFKAPSPSWIPVEHLTSVTVIALALFFVCFGADQLDIGRAEARIGLASGERLGPLGAIFGNWAPDVWPAQTFTSHFLASFEPGNWPTSSAIRWPAAIAAIIVGAILAGGTSRYGSTRAGMFFALCWFSTIGIMDRSSSTGIDFLMGLGTVAAIARVISRGSDVVAGLWASLAFLAGGWPPLVTIALTIIVIGGRDSRYTRALLLPPSITAALWSLWTISAAGSDVWQAALMHPLRQRADWYLGLAVLVLALPWSPLAPLVFSRSIRDAWSPDCKDWLRQWMRASIACVVAGTLVPGLSQAARLPALAGLSILVALCLDSAWSLNQNLSRSARITFFLMFNAIVVLWLTIMTYGCYLWSLVMPFYRPLGIMMAAVVLMVSGLTWSTLESGKLRRGIITLVVMAVGLKIVACGYYIPEWNYRHSQGPWGRAFAQWVPPRWTLYTFHEWPEDLMFFAKRRVRQLPGPRHLRIDPGDTSKYVLLQADEFTHWPETAPAIIEVARFQDFRCRERVIARTAQGKLPLGYRSGLVSPISDSVGVSDPDS